MKIKEVETKEELYKEVRKSDLSCVYLVKCNEYYKIGRSDRVISRVEGMQTSSPYEIQLVFVARTLNALELEKELHERFKGIRGRGEWFKMTNKDLLEFEKIIKERWELKENKEKYSKGKNNL